MCVDKIEKDSIDYIHDSTAIPIANTNDGTCDAINRTI